MSSGRRQSRTIRQRWAGLPLRWKGIVVVAIPIAPLFLFALAIVLSVTTLDRAERLVAHTVSVQSSLSAIEISLLDAESGVRGYLLSGDRSTLSPYDDARRSVGEQLRALPGLVADNPEQTARATELQQRVAARMQLLDRLVSNPPPPPPPVSNPPAPAPAASRIGEGRAAMAAFRDQIRQMNDAESRLLADRRARQQAARSWLRLIIGATALVGIGGGIAAVWLFARSITGRVAGVAANAQRLARGEPLLDIRSGDDEVGRLDRDVRSAAALLDRRMQELNVAREELDRFFGLSLDMLAISTVDGQFQRLNPAWTDTLGWTAEDLTATGYFDFIHPDDVEATRTEAALLAEGGSIVSFANRFRCKDGTYRWLSWKSAADVSRRRVYGAARDITEERRVAEALERHAAELGAARLEAERANVAKTEFLSHISHDLRTPLNAILGFAQLLEREPLAPLQKDSVRYICDAGNHLLTLISEVIDITRIESGRLSLSPEPVALSDVIEGALNLVRPLAADRTLTLTAAELPQGAAVLADPQRLRQILLNLLSNAVKYNRPNGRIDVTVSELPPGRWRIAIADTGGGLSPRHMALLFRPFERLGAEQAGIEGTGLGLAFSRSMAEAMGGAVGATSVLDAGSTFWVDLPAATLPSDALPLRPDIPATAIVVARRGTVLYFEDNPANVRLMERILRHRPGVETLSAATADAGLMLARERRPDLIFLDQHLGEATGEEVLRELWQEPATREIPVVMVTADATPGLARRLSAAGAREHLTKPIDVSRVLALVDRFLSDTPEPVDERTV